MKYMIFWTMLKSIMVNEIAATTLSVIFPWKSADIRWKFVSIYALSVPMSVSFGTIIYKGNFSYTSKNPIPPKYLQNTSEYIQNLTDDMDDSDCVAFTHHIDASKKNPM